MTATLCGFDDVDGNFMRKKRIPACINSAYILLKASWHVKYKRLCGHMIWNHTMLYSGFFYEG
jgi:hypothetical protein